MILYTEQENSMKKIFLNESQLRFLLETGDLTPNDNGTMDFKIDPIRLGTKTSQDSENQFADAVLGALDEYGYGENSLNGGGLDPTIHQNW